MYAMFLLTKFLSDFWTSPGSWHWNSLFGHSRQTSRKNYRFIIFHVVLQSVENHQLGLKTHRFVSISIIFFLKIKEKMMDVLSTYERKIYCEEKYKEKRRRDPWSFQCPAENPSLVHNVARNLLKIVLKVLYHWFHEAISLQLLKLILNGKDSLFYK